MHRHCPLTKTSANCRTQAIDWLERDKKIMDYAAESLKLHYKWQGKIEVTLRAPLETADPNISQTHRRIPQYLAQDTRDTIKLLIIK